MAITSNDTRYIYPDRQSLEEQLTYNALKQFRLIWNIYTGSIHIAPKSTMSSFGVDLGMYEGEVDLDTLKQKMQDFEYEREREALFLDLNQNKHQVYQDITAGELHLSNLPTSDPAYTSLKTTVQRRSIYYDSRK